MKTTINVDEALLKRAMSIYKVRTKTRIMEMGPRALIDAETRKKLTEAFGSQPGLTAIARRRPG